MSTTKPHPALDTTRDFTPLHGIDHVQLWVGDAAQASYCFTHCYGLTTARGNL